MKKLLFPIFIILAVITAGFFVFGSANADEKININTASVQELATLPGIGTVKAQAIIDYREQHGLFQTIEEIMNVSGIGPTTFENIKNLITVGNNGSEEEENGEEENEEEEEENIDKKVNINTAVLEELTALPGIGTVKAQAIIDYREQHGLFQTIEEIMNVSGIGPTTFENIKNLITVGNNGSEEENGEEEEEDEEEEENENGEDNGDEEEEENEDHKININTASVQELATLPGIGETKALAIISYREQHGPFKKIADITNVPGIGQTTFESLKDLITVGENEIEDPEEEEHGEAFYYNFGDVVINEFVSDPVKDEVEWIELYSKINRTVDLSGWTIEEGSGAKTELLGLLSYQSFFVVEKPKGNLNNAGDLIVLRDPRGLLIDKVVYGNWNDGSLEKNAPVAYRPFSTARKKDGLNTFKNIDDFSITTTPTKGKGNIITLLQEEEEAEMMAEEAEKYDYSQDILITEILPDPFGPDTENEFIELYNQGERSVYLLGWKLGDDSAKRYEFKESTVIGSGEYLVIYRKESKIALNNNGDSAKLFRPLKETPWQIVKYEKAIEGWSYALDDSGRWLWTEMPTPGEKNIIKTFNRPPEAAFSCPDEVMINEPIFFDCSDTYDEDGDSLDFYWAFGDGHNSVIISPQHTYTEPGRYTVMLTVSDGQAQVIKEKTIIVIDPDNPDKTEVAGIEYELITTGLIINEFFPNPFGSEVDGEWIELYNSGGVKINLLNWAVDDQEGGSRPYVFQDDYPLDAGGYYVLTRRQSDLILNNDYDEVRLFNPAGDLVDEISYEKAPEGESYARGENDKWFWTTVLTPGEKNIISVSGGSLAATMPKAGAISSSQTKKIPLEIAWDEVKYLQAGDLAVITGQVAVLPGLLGTQFFYIVEPSQEENQAGSRGLQIYSYKKDFPNLKVGDLIEAGGEISFSAGEMRLKTKQAEDMVVLKNFELPRPALFACDSFDEDKVGALISVIGEVVGKKGSSVYIDDGTDEITVYVKANTGISAKNLTEGTLIQATGILGKTTSGLRLLPRSKEDIIIKNTEVLASEQVFGEIQASDNWSIAKRDKKVELFGYLLVMAGAVIVLLSGLLLKAYRK